MGILQYENLFNDEAPLLTASLTTTTQTTTTSTPYLTPSSNQHSIDFTERLIEAGVSALVCFVFYLLRRVCQWLLDKVRTCTIKSNGTSAAQNITDTMKVCTGISESSGAETQIDRFKQSELIHL
jgi:hypothetical protein